MFYSCVQSPVTVEVNNTGVQALRVHRKRSDCSKAPRTPQKVDLRLLASSSCRELRGSAGTQGRPVAGFSCISYEIIDVSVLISAAVVLACNILFS